MLTRGCLAPKAVLLNTVPFCLKSWCSPGLRTSLLHILPNSFCFDIRTSLSTQRPFSQPPGPLTPSVTRKLQVSILLAPQHPLVQNAIHHLALSIFLYIQCKTAKETSAHPDIQTKNLEFILTSSFPPSTSS